MYKEGRRIIYEKGDFVGPYNIKFIKEIESHIQPNGNRVRRGIFICPSCEEKFEANILDIRNGRTKYCTRNGACFKKNSKVGPYNHIFINIVKPYISPNGQQIRRGEFICSFCNNSFIASISDIKNGHKKSCGCEKGQNKYQHGDIIGNNNIIFIKEVTPYISPSGHKRRKAQFLCPQCGNNFIALIQSIESNRQKTCGCGYRHNQNIPIGKKYGEWTVLDKIDNTDKRHIKWLCQCSCGTIKFIDCLSLKKNASLSCGCTHRSLGEEKIKNLLSKLQINFKQEKTFKECKNISYLRFDFYLPDYNCCIEYDGKQHFDSYNQWGEEKEFKKRQKNDEIKNQYCKDNNIKLIRIPYWNYDKLNEEYLLSLIEGK